MSDTEARQLRLILTALSVVLAAVSIIASIYFYTPSDSVQSERLSMNSAF